MIRDANEDTTLILRSFIAYGGGSHCRNLCERLGVKRTSGNGGYENQTLKFCSRCRYYVKKKYNRCPCCGLKLRMYPIKRDVSRVKRY